MHTVAPIAKNLIYLGWKASISLEKGLEEMLLRNGHKIK
jgi:nucleoside-diphosphate-sugar epimerase